MAVLSGGCEPTTGHLRQCWYHALEAPASLLSVARPVAPSCQSTTFTGCRQDEISYNSLHHWQPFLADFLTPYWASIVLPRLGTVGEPRLRHGRHVGHREQPRACVERGQGVQGGGIDLQGDPSGLLKYPVDLDLGCSAILPGQQVATVAASVV